MDNLGEAVDIKVTEVYPGQFLHRQVPRAVEYPV